MPLDLHEAVAARLADRAGRYTGARRDLIQVLAEAGRPLTVDEIVVRAPRQRPSSVYRNLAVFEAEGVVRRMAGVGDLARFELTEALVGHHHHLACQVCGAMTDVHLPHDLEQPARPRPSAASPRTEGFAVELACARRRRGMPGLCRRRSAGPDLRTDPSRRPMMYR